MSLKSLLAALRRAAAPRPVPSVPDAWRATRGGGTRILVVDSGLPDHLALGGALDVAASQSFVWGADVWDRCGHATAVCGIVHDWAPDARMVCYKVAKDEAGAKSVGSADLRMAFEAACDLRPDVVCCTVCFSAGVSKVQRSLGVLESLGIPVVCAAGNDAGAGVAYPARFDQAVAVGACDRRGRAARFSPAGLGVDCLFPGVRIPTLWIHGGRAVVSGTSYAAPCAAAVAALYIAHLRLGPGDGAPRGAGLVAAVRGGLADAGA